MKKILGVLLFVLVLILSGCVRFDGDTTVNLYVDDELYDSFEATIAHFIPLEIPEKEGMMFTGWEYDDGIVYDELEVGPNMELYATWEDPNLVFGFNEEAHIDYDGQYITSYTGSAIHMKLPAMVNDEYIRGIGHEVFKEKPIQTLFLPMDVELYGAPFIDSDIERIEFYGDYNIPVNRTMVQSEFDEIIDEYGELCVVQSGGTETSWKYEPGCPVIEVIEVSSIEVNTSALYVYDVLVDRNYIEFGTISQISTSVFEKATHLKTLELPLGMVTFFQFMLDDCVEFENLIIDSRNENYKIIDGIVYSPDESQIYYYPPGLKNERFEVPETVEYIHMHAFLTTTYLKTLVIPASFDESLYFYGAKSLEEIIVMDGNEMYRSIDGILYEGTELLKYPASKEETSYIIVEGTTIIRSSAFMDNLYLEEIEIPSSVTEIQSSAFYNSQSLKTLDIPSSVEILYQAIFHNSNVETIILRRDWTVDGDITMLIPILYGPSEMERTIYVPDASFTAYTSDDSWVNHLDDIKSIVELN